VRYDCGSAEHKLFLNTAANRITGVHIGWAGESAVSGNMDNDRVEFRSSLPTPGQRLSYRFSGRVSGDTMSGEVDLGEYGTARWTAKRHAAG
jgi:hypothetical protein